MIHVNTYNTISRVGHASTLHPDVRLQYYVDKIKFVLNGKDLKLVARPLNIKAMKQAKI